MMMMMTDPADLNNGSNERYLGAFTFAGNYEVKVQAPLDARAVVTSVEELLKMHKDALITRGIPRIY